LIDGHNDVTSATVRGLDLAQRRANGHTDIPRMKEGGMSAQFFAAYVAANHIDSGSAAHRALQRSIRFATILWRSTPTSSCWPSAPATS
jgi:microsomal dipeptidase-like Zn-dependent dipeptidase